MTMTYKIIYWIATLWLASGVLSTGALQLLKPKQREPCRRLAYRHYPFGLSRLFPDNTRCLESFGSCGIAYS